MSSSKSKYDGSEIEEIPLEKDLIAAFVRKNPNSTVPSYQQLAEDHVLAHPEIYKPIPTKRRRK